MQGKYHGSFDFIFVDADKDNYLNYHKRLLDLVKVGGVIGYDNTLWNGSVVAPPDAPLRKYVRYYRDFVLELNKALAADPRIEICQLPVGDGITLCRRISWSDPRWSLKTIYYSRNIGCLFLSLYLDFYWWYGICIWLHNVDRLWTNLFTYDGKIKGPFYLNLFKIFTSFYVFSIIKILNL